MSDSNRGRGPGGAGVTVWHAAADGSFLGSAPEDDLAQALAPHIQRIAREGDQADFALTLPGSAAPRQVHVALRALPGAPPTVAVALSERPAHDAHLLRRFDMAMEATFDGIWEWMIASEQVWWSERTNEFLGLPHGSEPSFELWASHIHPEDRERVTNGCMAVVHGHALRWADSYRIVQASGEVRYVNDRCCVERDRDGKPVRVVGQVTDVTDLRITERARQLVELRFRELAETIDDMIWMSDAETGELLYISPAMERISGYTPEQVMANRELYIALIHPDDREYVLQNAPTARVGHYDIVYRLVRPDGKIRYLRSRANPVYDSRGKAMRIAGLTSDITSQRQLEEQLLQAGKMESVGRLAGGVAHDFNNLLTVILSGCDFALRDRASPAEIRADIQQVREAALRAEKLTSQLLSFARRQVIAPVRLDLNELTRQMDSLLRRVIGEHIELVTLLSPELGPVLADRGQIEQVLVNLSINARDAMPDGGRLTLETANVRVDRAYADTHAHLTPGDYVMIAVSDTGVGIPREVQQHLFEPFFTTKPPGQGTGLGLATCYGIVRQAGGHILIYSEVGRGTTFKILLPRTELAGESDFPDATYTPPLGGHETVLFVEDDATVRQVGVRILTEQGYQVLPADCGRDALLVAAQHVGTIHLLVTDVVMPDMNGTELARKLHEQRPETRVLYASGYTENAIVHHGVLDDSVAFLQKPYVVDTLLAKVRLLLDEPP